jgi:hypothetical protein
MSAYRCTTCGINWPVATINIKCRQCGGTTWTAPNLTPDASKQAEPPTNMNAHTREADTVELLPFNPLYSHRFERYLEMGFSEASAAQLASVENDIGFPLWHGHVAKALAQGCTHEMALEIYG